MEHFAIVCFARSGSTWLSVALGSHPNIASGGEIFNPQSPFWKNWKALNEGKDDQQQYLNEMVEVGKEQRNITNKTKMCGYKLLYYQSNETNISSITKDTKIIHLKRRRHLMSVTSNLLVQNSQKAKVFKPHQADYVNPNITIKAPQHLHQSFKRREEQWANFDNVFKNHEVIEVWYEDMCSNPEREHETILSFLGVPQIPLKSHIKKQRDRLLRDTIINYGEASQHLIKML